MTTAGELRSGKGHRDENFPVASFLIAPRHRGIILAFYRFARTADDVADNAIALSMGDAEAHHVDDVKLPRRPVGTTEILIFLRTEHRDHDQRLTIVGAE